MPASAAPAYRADGVRMPEPQGLASLGQPQSQSAELPANQNATILVDPEDGSTVVNFDPPEEQNDNETPDKFYDNLAEKLSDSDLSALAQKVLDGIKADEDSRTDWVNNYTMGMELLGLKIEVRANNQPRSRTSTVKHPLLLNAVIKFQAQARGEMLPASGPVKVRNDGESNQDMDQRADDLERDMNHYLTVTASEYYPDTDRGLFYLGFGGTIFKKVYRCPLRRRPVSECVYLPDLIVSQDATDLLNATRVTHRIEMSQSDVKMMMDSGQYIDIALSQPTKKETKVDAAESKLTGVKPTVSRPEDEPRTLYECYTFLELDDYGVDEKGKPDGIGLPYKLTIEEATRKVIEIRRNWAEGDTRFVAKRRFVKFEFIPGIGFLALGLVHLLGNTTIALTAMERLIIDAAMFANFPAGVRVKGLRTDNNEINPGPGEFPEIDTNGLPIQGAIMSLPFKGPTGDVLALYQALEAQGEKLAGTADIETGDGRTNVPVGTIMAQIEQQTQVLTAIHKRLHAAQQEEFSLMKSLFAEDPETLWRDNPKAARKWSTAEELADLSMVPASDPNVPAHVHRLMIGTVLEQLAQAHPDIYNQYEVQQRLLTLLNVSDSGAILIPPQQAAAADQQQGGQQQQDPTTVALGLQAQADMASVQQKQAAAELSAQQKGQQAQLTQQQKMADLQLRFKQISSDMENAAADRVSRERIAALNAQTQLILAGLEKLGRPEPTDPVNDTSAGP